MLSDEEEPAREHATAWLARIQIPCRELRYSIKPAITGKRYFSFIMGNDANAQLRSVINQLRITEHLTLTSAAIFRDIHFMEPEGNDPFAFVEL